MKWNKISDFLPSEGSKVLIKTDCEDCPLNIAYFILNKFVPNYVCQCDKHYETDQKFTFIKFSEMNELNDYRYRIIEWISIAEEY